MEEDIHIMICCNILSSQFSKMCNFMRVVMVELGVASAGCHGDLLRGNPHLKHFYIMRPVHSDQCITSL